MMTIPQIRQSISKSLRRMTLLEWLVIVMIVTVLIAVLLPGAQWASSGDIEAPVRVLVFDAKSATPIAGARVGILRSPPWYNEEFLKDFHERFASEIFDGIVTWHQGVTDADGLAVITYKFRTGASHKRPTPHAHTDWVWVAVQAEGYGGAVVPVRHESSPTPQLRKQKELRVPSD